MESDDKHPNEDRFNILEPFYDDIQQGFLGRDRVFAENWIRNHRDKIKEDAKRGILAAKNLLEKIEEHDFH